MLAGREVPLFLCHFKSVGKLNYEKVETVVLHDFENEYSLTIAFISQFSICSFLFQGSKIVEKAAKTVFKRHIATGSKTFPEGLFPSWNISERQKTPDCFCANEGKIM